MNIFDFFRRSNKTATTAKERLQIVVSHQRKNQNAPDFLPKMRQELLEVVCKYVEIDQEQVQVNLQQESNHSVLELNVTLPDLVSAT